MRELIEVNVLGSLYCGSAAARAMRAQGTGSIVNMATLAMVGQSTAATNTAFTLEVVDTVTGRRRTYTNADLAPAAPVLDSAAFPCAEVGS